MWEQTITLFNSYENSAYEMVYLKTVFNNARFTVSKGANVDTNGKINIDNTLCMIRHDSLPKPYLEPKEWVKVAENKKQNYFTFQEGDVIVKGEVTENVISFEELNKKYDNVFKISDVTNFDFGLKHFEVNAK